MGNIGGGEILVILLVALVVLGPDKLPDAIRKVGQVVSEVRKVSNGFQAEMRTAMLDHDPNRRPQPAPAPELADDDPPPARPATDTDARTGSTDPGEAAPDGDDGPGSAA